MPLKVLWQKEFQIQRLEVIRDIFLFYCFTGLSFIDVLQLKYDHISNDHDGVIRFIKPRQKTKIETEIDFMGPINYLINKYVDSPLKQNPDTILPVPSNQKMNAYLKEIADLCGITKTLTTHVARHTFATLLLVNDVPMEVVAKKLGHTSTRQTALYAIPEKKYIMKQMAKVIGVVDQAFLPITGSEVTLKILN